MESRLAATSDLPPWAFAAAIVLAAGSLVLLAFELRRASTGGLRGLWVALTGLLAVASLVVAVLRPVRIRGRETSVGARVIALVDGSRSMDLESHGEKRRVARDRALADLLASHPDVRFQTMTFGDGAPVPFAPSPEAGKQHSVPAASRRSDLSAALRVLAGAADEHPDALVVISDGRLDDPPEGAGGAELSGFTASWHVPVDAVATTADEPRDASVRRVGVAGAAIAHVPFPLRVDVGCGGGLACDELTVTARELREDGAPALLASGIAHLENGKATVELTITLERAGARILEIEVAPPAGDTIPDNDRRLVALDVARERVRILHVAGRPTNDTRALRQWLKRDASVDVVAFFILRTPADNTGASQDELALIPFPVEKLFSESLPTFDAVVLQDFDAQPYHLERYLPDLQRYVRGGGGLIMVGGPNSFVAGGYAGTPLADVLPVSMDGSPGATAADTSLFTPAWTDIGRTAPLLAPLRAVTGDDLPQMPGTNVLGDVKPGSVVLWKHPTRKTKSGAAMPVLAVGDEGNGRAIALSVDGGWLFEFSPLGARTAGRGHGALWDGLLGWLMRDPRFEPAQVALDECTAGVPAVLRVTTPRGEDSKASEHVSVEVKRLDQHGTLVKVEADVVPGEATPVTMPALEAGGYTARLAFQGGSLTKRDFACESGGNEYADSRPDAARLRAIAAATGGAFVFADAASQLHFPKPTVISTERHVVPIAPPWVWTAAAALLLGAHWFVRRRGGLA